MSTGIFDSDKSYKSDTGVFYPVKVQPETLLAVLNGIVNSAPTVPITGGDLSENSAKISGSRRSYGTHTRTVSLRFTGVVPSGYKAGGTVTIPILDPDVYLGIKKNQTGTYLGNPVKIVSKRPEVIR